MTTDDPVNRRLPRQRDVPPKRKELFQTLNQLLRINRILIVVLFMYSNTILAQKKYPEKYKYKWCENNVNGMQYPISDKDSIVVTISYQGYSHDSIIFNHPVIYGTNLTRFKIEKIDESWEDNKTWSGHKMFIVVADKANRTPISIYMTGTTLSIIIDSE